jgi:uncharacterized protein (TIGR03067 family)
VRVFAQFLNLNRLAMLGILLAVAGCTEGNPKFSVDTPNNGKDLPPTAEVKINMEVDSNFVLAEDSLQGTWKMHSVTINGAGLPAGMVQASSLQFTGDKYKLGLGGVEEEGTFVQDISKSPVTMTLNCEVGEHAGKSMKAIYEMPNAGVMRLCYDPKGENTPDSFESNPENGRFTAVMVR